MQYASQILNFGKQFQYNLAAKSLLIVGAGVCYIIIFIYQYILTIHFIQALGNEIIKGMAMSGMCTREKGVAIVVDNDLIMTSNISRQLCFSENDTHKTKADTLCRKAGAMFNSHMRLVKIYFIFLLLFVAFFYFKIVFTYLNLFCINMYFN